MAPVVRELPPCRTTTCARWRTTSRRSIRPSPSDACRGAGARIARSQRRRRSCSAPAQRLFTTACGACHHDGDGPTLLGVNTAAGAQQQPAQRAARQPAARDPRRHARAGDARDRLHAGVSRRARRRADRRARRLHARALRAGKPPWGDLARSRPGARGRRGPHAATSTICEQRPNQRPVHRRPSMPSMLSPAQTLPRDADRATLVGRLWQPGVGPVVVAVHEGGLHDLSRLARDGQPAARARRSRARRCAGPARRQAPRASPRSTAVLANSDEAARDPQQPWLLAPCDLQAVKASGVTFVASLLERVIEEQARGDAAKAEAIRAGARRRHRRQPGRHRARLGRGRSAQGGADRARARGRSTSRSASAPTPRSSPRRPCCPRSAPAPRSACIRNRPGTTPSPRSCWRSTAAAALVGAALGNDVNLRDFEGRSALLLGKAKDNNASCAIGPFIRLFDERLRHRRRAPHERGAARRRAGRLHARRRSSMAKISRDPLDLVSQAIGPHHRIPTA